MLQYCKQEPTNMPWEDGAIQMTGLEIQGTPTYSHTHSWWRQIWQISDWILWHLPCPPDMHGAIDAFNIQKKTCGHTTTAFMTFMGKNHRLRGPQPKHNAEFVQFIPLWKGTKSPHEGRRAAGGRPSFSHPQQQSSDTWPAPPASPFPHSRLHLPPLPDARGCSSGPAVLSGGEGAGRAIPALGWSRPPAPARAPQPHAAARSPGSGGGRRRRSAQEPRGTDGRGAESGARRSRREPCPPGPDCHRENMTRARSRWSRGATARLSRERRPLPASARRRLLCAGARGSPPRPERRQNLRWVRLVPAKWERCGHKEWRQCSDSGVHWSSASVRKSRQMLLHTSDQRNRSGKQST